MNLFKLVGSIFVDNSAANDSISKTDEKASGLGNTLAKGAKTVAKWGVAIASAAAVAGAAIFSSATSAAAAADNIDKMSQKIGISREAYQELDFICSQSGMSVDKLQAGVKSLTAAMDGARDGTQSNVEEFEKLGVVVTNADGSFRSQEDVLWDTLSALQGMTDQTEKARLASELFGKSGTELMPLLNGASGSIEEMKQQAHDLGLVLNDELITNGVNLTDSLDQTKRAFQSIAVNIGGAFMPIIEQLSDAVQEFVPTIQDMLSGLTPVIQDLLIDGIVPIAMTLISEIFPQVLDLANAIIPVLTSAASSVLPAIMQVISMILPAATDIITTVLPIALELLQPLLDLLQPILDLLDPVLALIVALAGPLATLLVNQLEPVIEITTYLLQELLPPISEALMWLADFINEYLSPAIELGIESNSGFIRDFIDEIKILIDGVATFISGTLNVIMGVVNVFLQLINGDFEGAGDALLQILTGLKDMLVGLLEAAFFNVIEFIQRELGDISGTFSDFGKKIGQFFSQAWDYALSTTQERFVLIKNAIQNAMESMSGIVGGIIERIKGFFNFEFQIPRIKMPHFTIRPTGWDMSKLLQGTIPKLNVEWYAKAMNNPRLLSSPTVFGYDAVSGKALAGGEAGPEVVSGADTLMNMIGAAVSEKNERIEILINLIIELLNKCLQTIAGMQIVLDSGEVVGALAPQIDAELGRLMERNNRRV